MNESTCPLPLRRGGAFGLHSDFKLEFSFFHFFSLPLSLFLSHTLALYRFASPYARSLSLVDAARSSFSSPTVSPRGVSQTPGTSWNFVVRMIESEYGPRGEREREIAWVERVNADQAAPTGFAPRRRGAPLCFRDKDSVALGDRSRALFVALGRNRGIDFEYVGRGPLCETSSHRGNLNTSGDRIFRFFNASRTAYIFLNPIPPAGHVHLGPPAFNVFLYPDATETFPSRNLSLRLEHSFPLA